MGNPEDNSWQKPSAVQPENGGKTYYIQVSHPVDNQFSHSLPTVLFKKIIQSLRYGIIKEILIFNEKSYMSGNEEWWGQCNCLCVKLLKNDTWYWTFFKSNR